VSALVPGQSTVMASREAVRQSIRILHDVETGLQTGKNDFDSDYDNVKCQRNAARSWKV
jgi:hypothetical protein